MKNSKRSQWIRSTTYALCLAGAALFLARFCHYQTRGFALSKITANFPLSPASPTAGLEEIPPGLNMPFHFLNRGFQSFVFVSADGQFVLKLFSNRYQHKIRLFSLLARLPSLERWALQEQLQTRAKLDHTFASYQLAWDEMADRTAQIYLHLAPSSHLPHSLTLIDPLQISHHIDLNHCAFLLQRRVHLVYPALQQWIDSRQLHKAREALSSLLRLFVWKWTQAIADNDPLIRTNYGFLGTEAIQIDTGPLSKQETPASAEAFQKELRRITASLRNWLTQNSPRPGLPS